MKGLLWSLGAAAMLAACADDKVAGATSETTNGDVQAVLTTSAGLPAARVTVRVVDEAGWMEKLVDGRSPILDSAVTDDRGGFKVRVPVARRCNLQVESGGEGLVVRGIDSLADTGQGVPVSHWRLAPLSTLAGKVGADTGLVEALRLAGTLYSATVTGDGLYRFEGIAADTHQAVARVYHSEAARPAMARAVAVAPGLEVIAPDMQVGVHRILIDDFERGFGATALGRLLGGGGWFLNSDTLSGGTSTREVSLVGGAEAYAGTSLHARYLLGTRLENPFATVAFHLGPKARAYDLGALQAISFRARGSGDVIVRFTSKSVQAVAADSAHFHFSVPLPAEWTRIVIPVDSLRVFANAPAGLKTWPWSRAAKDVTTIDFKASRPSSAPGDTVLLWLDEVQLEGVPLERFVP